MDIAPSAARRIGLYGTTRTSVRARHALLTEDGIVAGKLPGWTGADCYTTISPAIGSRFCQYRIELSAAGAGTGDTGLREWFLYVRDGGVSVSINGQQKEPTGHGGYIYLPPHSAYEILGSQVGASLLVFEKTYEALADTEPPTVFRGQEQEITGVPFLGDTAAMLQTLLPDAPAFDMAVNIFKYAPGATLPFVETHVMEHGLLMLAGEGIYRLEDSWYPVRAGDAIWMAPYCPQWFVATGKTPASYVYYKDVNRWPT